MGKNALDVLLEKVEPLHSEAMQEYKRLHGEPLEAGKYATLLGEVILHYKAMIKKIKRELKYMMDQEGK